MKNFVVISLLGIWERILGPLECAEGYCSFFIDIAI